MIEWVAVAGGGAIGATLRHSITQAMPAISGTDFPLATLLVNLFGCAVIGLITAWFDAKGTQDSLWQVFLMIGILGGFTTFSTIITDAMTLVDRNAMIGAAGYIALSVTGGIMVFILCRFMGAIWLK